MAAVIGLTEKDVRACGAIVAADGFDRRRVLDRRIAAQVLARGVSLVTAHGADFTGIPGLRLIPW